MLLLSMCRHPCRHQAGILTLISMTPLPLIRNGNVASLRCHPQPGVVALVAMALSSSSMSLPSLLIVKLAHCPCCDGVVAINLQASVLLL
jgi:hypothetical protein